MSCWGALHGWNSSAQPARSSRGCRQAGRAVRGGSVSLLHCLTPALRQRIHLTLLQSGGCHIIQGSITMPAPAEGLPRQLHMAQAC